MLLRIYPSFPRLTSKGSNRLPWGSRRGSVPLVPAVIFRDVKFWMFQTSRLVGMTGVPYCGASGKRLHVLQTNPLARDGKSGGGFAPLSARPQAQPPRSSHYIYEGCGSCWILLLADYRAREAYHTREWLLSPILHICKANSWRFDQFCWWYQIGNGVIVEPRRFGHII